MIARDWAFFLGGILGGLVAGVAFDRAMDRYLPPKENDQCLDCLLKLSACEAALQYERKMSQELHTILTQQESEPDLSFRVEGFASSP
jgi:hypothetical protein